MWKKVLFMSLIFCLLFGAAVEAANLWGNYKGNPIIKVVDSKGKQLKSSNGVPAISYNGTVMVPLSMVNDRGLHMDYNAKNQTVTATNSSEQLAQDNLRKMNRMKFYSDAADLNNSLFLLGTKLQVISVMLTYVEAGLDSETMDFSATMDNYDTELASCVKLYNLLYEGIDSLSDKAKQFSESAELASNILTKYSDAINAYKDGLSALRKYEADRTDANNQKYKDSIKKAGELITDALTSSRQEYVFNLAMLKAIK